MDADADAAAAVVYILLVISLGLTAGVQSLGDPLNQVIGLAWDCGAVTTGPVTVPCVIALGVGVVAASPTSAGADNPLSAFGLVTMASLFPVSTVLCLSMLLCLQHPLATHTHTLPAPVPAASDTMTAPLP